MVSITILATLIARPEMKDELQHILAQQIEPTRAEPGCIHYDLHVAMDDECRLVFYESWKREEDLANHMQMPHLRPLLDNVDRLLAAPIEIRRLNMISERA